MNETRIPGVIVSDLDRKQDDRGFLIEIARMGAFDPPFMQMNHSHSKRGVLRGLHYHQEQSDLWYVSRGRAQVALADLREGAETRAETLILDADTPATVFIPPGVAHGYLALTDLDVFYLVTREYDGADEFGLAWDDPLLAIEWQNADPILSERDRSNPSVARPPAWNPTPNRKC